MHAFWRVSFAAVLLAVWAADGLTSIHHGDDAFLTILGDAAVTGPTNCIPFGSGDFGPYKGFVYSGVSSFTLQDMQRVAFDLGASNDNAIVVDIAVAATSVDGGSDVDSNGFTTICSACTPASPNGNTVANDFELEYTLNAGFGTWSFAGGGLAVRFRAQGSFANDVSCDSGVLMGWDASDTSGSFVGRFYTDSGSSTSLSNLDDGPVGGFAVFNSAPTLAPTPLPIPAPSVTATPTLYAGTFTPSVSPTDVPSPEPFPQPTPSPLSFPTPQPTARPTLLPTLLPTPRVTGPPSLLPTTRPTRTGIPSALPSPRPSAQPTERPTHLPLAVPSQQPTIPPSPLPSIVPSPLPTYKPTFVPSPQPTRTDVPTPQPSLKPSPVPTYVPSLPPSPAPTPKPTPTPPPSMLPSPLPTTFPSEKPTPRPSHAPIIEPTSRPTLPPQLPPTTKPSFQPSHVPTHAPSKEPSFKPTSIPTHPLSLDDDSNSTSSANSTSAAGAGSSSDSIALGMASAGAVLGVLALIFGSVVCYRAKTQGESFSEALYATARTAAGLDRSGAQSQLESNEGDGNDGNDGEAKRRTGSAGAGIPTIRLETTRRYKIELKEEKFAAAASGVVLDVAHWVDEVLDRSCSICLGDMEIRKDPVKELACGHCFHAKCLNQWLEQKFVCPNCKAPARKPPWRASSSSSSLAASLRSSGLQSLLGGSSTTDKSSSSDVRPGPRSHGRGGGVRVVSRTSSFTASDQVLFQTGDSVSDLPSNVAGRGSGGGRGAASNNGSSGHNSRGGGGRSHNSRGGGGRKSRNASSFEHNGFAVPRRSSSFSLGGFGSILGSSTASISDGPDGTIGRGSQEDVGMSLGHDTSRPRGSMLQSNFLQTNSSNPSNRVSLEAIESAGDVELQQALRASVQTLRPTERRASGNTHQRSSFATAAAAQLEADRKKTNQRRSSHRRSSNGSRGDNNDDSDNDDDDFDLFDDRGGGGNSNGRHGGRRVRRSTSLTLGENDDDGDFQPYGRSGNSYDSPRAERKYASNSQRSCGGGSGGSSGSSRVGSSGGGGGGGSFSGDMDGSESPRAERKRSNSRRSNSTRERKASAKVAGETRAEHLHEIFESNHCSSRAPSMAEGKEARSPRESQQQKSERSSGRRFRESAKKDGAGTDLRAGAGRKIRSSSAKRTMPSSYEEEASSTSALGVSSFLGGATSFLFSQDGTAI